MTRDVTTTGATILTDPLTPEAATQPLRFTEFPVEASTPDELIAAMGAAFPPKLERRRAPRVRYQVVATLEVDGEERTRPGGLLPENRTDLHTRDLDANNSGFVSPHQLTPGESAILNLPTPTGETRRIECRVRRSRPVAEGLFEGCVEFTGGEQPVFSDRRIKVR